MNPNKGTGSVLPLLGVIAYGIVGANFAGGAGFLAGAVIGGLWGLLTSVWLGLLKLPIEMIRQICNAIAATTVISIVALMIAVAKINQ